MLKGSAIAIGIIIVCTLENISHLFGFCFHGVLSSMIGVLSVCGLGLVLYLKQFKLWLDSRDPTRKPHKCKDHNHKEEL